MNVTPAISPNTHIPATIDTQPSDQTMPACNLGYGPVSHELAVNATLQLLYERTLSDLDTVMSFDNAALPTGTHTISTPSHKLCPKLRSDISAQRTVLQANQLHSVNVFQPRRRTTLSALPSEVAQSVIAGSGEFITILCTQNVLKRCEPVRLQSQGHVHNSVNELPLCHYLSAEADFKEYMSSSPQVSCDRWRIPQSPHLENYDPFPAPFLAYMNLDRENAYKLWQSTAGERRVVDVIRRSFAHMLAEAGDSNLLDRMGDKVLKDAGCDARGLSLLDLGVIGDSLLIVKTLVENGIVPPPYTHAMQRAIIGGRLQIADYLLTHLASTPWHDSHELNTLASLAAHYGFKDLELGLAAVVLDDPNPQDALDYLDALGVQLQSDDPVISENTSFDSLGVPDWTSPPDFGHNQNLFENSEYNTLQSSRADPGGGTHDFSCWQPYPPS